MANHTYTLTNLTDAISHALGGTPSSGTSATNIANDALQFLVQYAPWTWLRKELSLNFTASASFIAMPADFESIQNVSRNTPLEALVPVTLETIHLMRSQGNLIPAFSVAYAMSYTGQASVTAEGTWRMEIYPTPTANATAAIIGTYLRQIPKLSGGTDVADIPAPWHPPLKSLCRAMAVSDQFQEQNVDWQRAKDALDALVDRDGATQPNLGRMNGAVGRLRSYRGDTPGVRGTIVTP